MRKISPKLGMNCLHKYPAKIEGTMPTIEEIENELNETNKCKDSITTDAIYKITKKVIKYLLLFCYFSNRASAVRQIDLAETRFQV